MDGWRSDYGECNQIKIYAMWLKLVLAVFKCDNKINLASSQKEYHQCYMVLFSLSLSHSLSLAVLTNGFNLINCDLLAFCLHDLIKDIFVFIRYRQRNNETAHARTLTYISVRFWLSYCCNNLCNSMAN